MIYSTKQNIVIDRFSTKCMTIFVKHLHIPFIEKYTFDIKLSKNTFLKSTENQFLNAAYLFTIYDKSMYKNFFTMKSNYFENTLKKHFVKRKIFKKKVNLLRQSFN